MAVTSAPQAMPPQHLWDPKQRVHISRWHYKREDAHVGSFPMIVGYFLTIFPKSVVIVSFLCCNTTSFDCSPLYTLHVVHLILWSLACTVGTYISG